MLLSDSEISMRPLCSYLLFKPLDYMFDEMFVLASRGLF